MEGRVNWRRILAGILSAGLLGLCALFLPSLHRTTHPSSQSLPPAAPVPENVNSSAGPDIDPHKAFGSKSAPVTMEVFSDYQCPACKQLYLSTNRQLMDNYVS